MHGSANGHTLRGVHSGAFSGNAATIVEPSPPPSPHADAGPLLREVTGYPETRFEALVDGGAIGPLGVPPVA